MKTKRSHLIFAFALLWTKPASADDSVARADRLFKEGTESLEKRQFEDACPKLAESRKLDPKALGTLVNLARCNEEWGKTATAYTLYAELEQRATEKKQNERIELAKRHRAALLPKLSRVTIKLAARAPNESAKLDGDALPADRFDNAFAVDPGPHSLEISAPDRETWKHPFDLAPASNETINVPELAPATAVATTKPVPPAAETAPPPAREEAGSSRKTVGFIVGGAGIVALGVGAFFGVRAIGKKSDVDDQCGDDRAVCRNFSAGHDAYEGAQSSALLSTILVPVGLVATGVGIFLVVTSPKSSSSASVILAPSLGGLSMRGAF